MSQNSVRRKRLHAEDPTCHWCGTPTVLEAPSAASPDLATIDHLVDRVEAHELGISRAERNERAVLACQRCNQRRNRMGMKGRPETKVWRARR